MEESLEHRVSLAELNSPFMSFDDVYHTAGDRPSSSFEEFWEQRGASSAGNEELMGSLPARRSLSNYGVVARTMRTMTMPEFRISSMPRVSSLSQARLSSLSKASDFGNGRGDDESSTVSKPRSFVSRLVSSSMSKRMSLPSLRMKEQAT